MIWCLMLGDCTLMHTLMSVMIINNSWGLPHLHSFLYSCFICAVGRFELDIQHSIFCLWKQILQITMRTEILSIVQTALRREVYSWHHKSNKAVHVVYLRLLPNLYLYTTAKILLSHIQFLSSQNINVEVHHSFLV